MKLGAIMVEGKEQIGLQFNGKMYPLNELEKVLLKKETLPKTLIEGIKQGETFLQLAEKVEDMLHTCWDCQVHQLNKGDYRLLAPIPHPTKNIICVGKNYAEHAIEMGGVEDIPKHPMIFTKAPTTVIGHEMKIDAHWHVTNEVDYEGELGVIIGTEGKNISEENALDYVFGYTIINDVSARDLQTRHKQFFLGKSIDTYCPTGPVIVTANEINNPNDLHILTKVNGEIRQNGYTKDMIFSVASLIATLSKGMTLQPGDIIATGTPAGVGKGFKPPKYLQSGDVVSISIEGIGELVNVVK